ncbi:hypothetical protein HNV11_15915 [Spirosoma taeanense]|uniref:Cyclophilin-like domain-containing protein n=1 Tax=Spirosoma taeanense TaxID=2735870 RepID=A0A6M5Y9U7_9BACT|nr:cyclophilin-like fold protein [Spirosoma taeanense]QJW90759.1 hypothetical protein HNV11_15915 [Spirosoma taeanense]
MKQTQLLLLPILLFIVGSMACKTDNLIPVDQPTMSNPASPDPNLITDSSSNRLRVRVGSSTFTATLLSNPTVTAFKARLPLTLSMKELNGNEKFADLPNGLPTNATNPGTIQAGDLMLYGSSTLVLFYESFRTSYSYTKLGRIDNPAGLAAALGRGSVTVSFTLE